MNDIKLWKEIARENQIFPKGDWSLWMILAGRGFGKTRTGAENVMELINSRKYNRIAVIGKTIKEARNIMVEGVSGLLSTTFAQIARKNEELGIVDDEVLNFRYYKSKSQIVWENGATAYLIGADDYDSMRGLQFDLIWVDEFAKFLHPEEIWTQVMFTLRLGENPICIMTTTPRPLKILKELSEDEKTCLTKGSTFENKANLSAKFIETMRAKYVETRYGKQELYGELTLDKENSVWKKESIRYKEIENDALERVVIGVDPSVSVSENSSETGIIVAGLGFDEKVYVLEDLSGKYTPAEWAKTICSAYQDYQADNVIAETNNGGDLVGEMIRTIHPNIPISQAKAIKGKVTRAHPIALLYESNRVFHTKRFEKLENQMLDLSYDENLKNSPDRVDALVWAIQDLKTIGNKRYNISSVEF